MLVGKMGGQKGRKLWTTGQIARLLGTTPKTVTDYIDGGEMKAVRMPLSNIRRVHRDRLREFCEKYSYDWAIEELNFYEANGFMPGEGPEEEGEAEPEPPKKKGPAPKKKR